MSRRQIVMLDIALLALIAGGDSWWWHAAMQRVGYSLLALTAAPLW